jgi:Flp pilus assembly protein TadD
VSEDNSGAEAYDGENAYALYQRGMELLATGNAHSAAIVLARLKGIDSSPSVLEAYARAVFDAAQYFAAIDAFEELVERSPDADYGHYGLGMSYWRTQNFIKSRDHLAMAMVMRPDRSEYATALSQVKATLRARIEAGLPLEGPIEVDFGSAD